MAQTIAVAIMAAIGVMLPLVPAIVLMSRKKASLVPLLAGIAASIAALGLRWAAEALMGNFLRYVSAPMPSPPYVSLILYIIYALTDTLMLMLAVSLIRRRYDGVYNAMLCGLGCGGAAVTALACFSLLVYVLHPGGGLDTSIGWLIAQAVPLAAGVVGWAAGIALAMALAVMLWLALSGRGPRALVPLAFALLAMSLFAQKNLFGIFRPFPWNMNNYNELIQTGVLAVIAVIACLAACALHKKYDWAAR